MPTSTRRVARAAAVIVAALAITGGVAAAQSGGPTSLRNRLGFTPLDDTPQSCSVGSIRWSPDVTATKVMQRGDAATLLGGGSATVPGENDMIASDPSGQYVFTVSETGSDGALTRLDTATGEKVIIAQRPDWNRLDPVKWYAPSGVLLVGEEDGTSGSFWQVDPQTGGVTELLWLGKMSHEGIAFASDGAIWEGDENHTGAIYRAVPSNPADLTAGGTLSYLVDGVGFVPLPNPVTAVDDAFAGGATLFDRPEDFDQRDGKVYFTVTEPPDDAAASSTPGHSVHEGGVYTVNDTGVPHAVKFAAVNDPAVTDPAQAKLVRGLQFPDNLAFDRKGNLIIHEDIPDGATNIHSKQFRDQQDELWVALPDENGDGVSDGLFKLADMGNSPSAAPCQNEWTGGLLVGDHTLFINQQHADNPTWRVEFLKGKELNGA
jgi:hypothetical protein